MEVQMNKENLTEDGSRIDTHRLREAHKILILLQSDIGNKILNIVERNPFISTSEISRLTTTSFSVTSSYLGKLRRLKVILVKKDGSFRYHTMNPVRAAEIKQSVIYMARS